MAGTNYITDDVANVAIKAGLERAAALGLTKYADIVTVIRVELDKAGVTLRRSHGGRK